MKHVTHSILKLGVVVFACVASYMLHVTYANAQDIIPLIVGPARQQITVNPGEQAAFSVKFYNESGSPISGMVRVADFVVQDKEGSPRIIEDATQSSPRFSASSWVTLPYDRMSITANDKVIVQASLAVQKDARPGGRYISVYFEPTTAVPQGVNDEAAGQGVSPRIASLLYIRVAGQITESALVNNLFTKSFHEYGPIKVESEILNRGDYHIRPRGIISLTDSWGGIMEQSPLKEENIFPDAARSYENTLGTKWMMGRYKITLVASYGERGQALERSIYFWVFPWKVATVIALSLIIVLFFGRSLYMRLAVKEANLEHMIQTEKEEIEKLREELKKRKE